MSRSASRCTSTFSIHTLDCLAEFTPTEVGPLANHSGVKAILIRVGIDHEYGGWNAPVDPSSRRFVYVPIPETQEPLSKLVRTYDEVRPTLRAFSDDLKLTPDLSPRLPNKLFGSPMPLDPDFEHLTYGDNGANRG